MKFLSILGQRAILLWSLLVSILFSLSSLLIRTIMPMDGSEMSQIWHTNIVFFIMLVIFVGLFLFLIYLSQYLKASHLFLLGSALYLLLGAYLIFHQNDMIRHDSLQVLESAKAMNRGDFSQLTDLTGYLHRFPHQLGLVSFERLILIFFGNNNVKIFFVINLLMAIADNFLLWQMTENAFHNSKVTKITIILSFIFLPHLFFILFVYGLTYGLFFAMLGLYNFQLYLQKRTWLSLGLTVIFLSLSNLIRSNNSILILTVLVVAILDILSNHLKKSVILVLALILFVIVANKVIGWHYNTSKIEGEPKIAWVAMGLDDKSNIYHRIPGWYNAYLEDVYVKYKGDPDEIKKDSHRLIARRLKIMQDNPDYGFTFFKNKFLSTWTDSLFESIWSGPVTKMPVENQKISGRLMVSIYEGGLAFRLIYYFSALLLFIVYSAVLPFLFNQWRIIKEEENRLFLLVPLVYLSGGLIFHLLWETKSQYVYPYVYLLLPLSAFGLYSLYNKVKDIFKRHFFPGR
ncbi:hypothetical protein [Streptococcus tangpeifui]|uniref:hypothetical protein n=1 Tax=Streptococcus tangpeifui TaxID=2709400 RepID=UPI0013EAB7DC|nr:hypothetical protein [Streptococcus sp. ZJ373]